MTRTVIPTFETYERGHEEFERNLPEEFNPAVDFLRKHDDTSRTALRYERTEGDLETYSFDDLDTGDEFGFRDTAIPSDGSGDRAPRSRFVSRIRLESTRTPIRSESVRYRLRQSPNTSRNTHDEPTFNWGVRVHHLWN